MQTIEAILQHLFVEMWKKNSESGLAPIRSRERSPVHASEEEDINPLFTELISDAEGKAWSVLGSLADGLREYYQRQLWIQVLL